MSGTRNPLPPPINGSSMATSTDMPAFKPGGAIFQPDDHRERRNLLGLRSEFLDFAFERQIGQVRDFHLNVLAEPEALEGWRRHQE